MRIKIFVVIMVLLLLSSCGRIEQKGEKSDMASSGIEVKDVTLDSSEMIASNIEKEDNNFRKEESWSVEKKQIDKIKTITFLDKDYTGIYENSRYQGYNNYLSDYYNCDDCVFSINEENETLDSIRFYTQKEGSATIEECEEIAIQVASSFINTDDYYLVIDSDEMIHHFYFYKYVDGHETCEMLSVAVRKTGDISSVHLKSIGKIDNAINNYGADEVIRKIDLLTSTEAEALVKDKTQKDYSRCNDIEILNSIVVVLNNNDIGVLYDVDAIERIPDGEDVYTETGERLSILLTENNN